MIESDRQPPFALMLRFLSALSRDDAFSRAPQLLTEEQHEALSPRFQDVEPAQAFYHRRKEVLIEAAVLVHENAPPDSATAPLALPRTGTGPLSGARQRDWLLPNRKPTATSATDLKSSSAAVELVSGNPNHSAIG